MPGSLSQMYSFPLQGFKNVFSITIPIPFPGFAPVEIHSLLVFHNSYVTVKTTPFIIDSEHRDCVVIDLGTQTIDILDHLIPSTEGTESTAMPIFKPIIGLSPVLINQFFNSALKVPGSQGSCKIIVPYKTMMQFIDLEVLSQAYINRL